MSKSSRVRVKHKGQVTIPSELRSRLGMEEGAILEVEESKGAIILRLVPPLKAGRVVGAKVYEQVIRELDQTRKDWRWPE
ncbi:MAG: AbrB/MazE/SpoVT family DNA-binding domain-containing protein [Nitrososphaerales archaeon]|jgi:AbrB family looped-hinge helix DNA binding protein